MLSTLIRGLVPALALAAPLSAVAQGELVVYCTVQEEWCRPMVAAFEKATGIKVLMTRKSSGEFYAQIKAEAANPQRRRLVGRHRRPASAGRRGGPDRAVQVAEAWASCRTGRCGRRRHRRAAPSASTPARSATATTRDQLKKKNIPEPKCWADLDEARVQGRDPGRQSELVGHVVHDARDARAAHGRGQGVRLPEGDAQEREPVHEVGRGAGARGGHGREPGRHHVPARCACTRRSAARRSRSSSPCEGTGYEIGSMSIIKGAKNMENAKKWYDWALHARSAGDRRAAQGELPGAVEQDRARAAAGAQARPRSSSSTTTSRSTARRRSARGC